MGTIFLQEEMVLKRAQDLIQSGQIETENDKILYENLLQEYTILLKQIKRIVKISDKIGGKLNNTVHTIDEISKIDYLTNIYNRRYFDELLLQEWENCKKNDEVLSVFMIDVDYFKLYNDIYGHMEGDKALQKVAKGIKNVLKGKRNIVARYGGEEFVVLIPGTNAEEAKILGNETREFVEKQNIVHSGSKEHKVVTISVGIATSEDKTIVSCKDLIKMADKALYNAKALGRNRIKVWNGVMEASDEMEL